MNFFLSFSIKRILYVNIYLFYFKYEKYIYDIVKKMDVSSRSKDVYVINFVE